MELLIASSNPHKVEEIRAVLAPLEITIIGLHDLNSAIPEPQEDGGTFEENARIKATAYATATRRVCLADDSGLEVDALGGAPGIHSARYAGSGGTREQRDRANNERLLSTLEAVPDHERTARFVCAMCLSDEDGNVLAETRGTLEGIIAHEPRGSNGFGYDPLLYLPTQGCTSAQLSREEKNERSHRGVAARKMAAMLKELLR